ncbi:NAD dependent epimerase dehydratase [Seminavis robusta]|uniref:NAD dependent epimerase dehydratase n=1 Tax=Seminavis robusta TaxID=568900 RepID=A0A9N8HUN5_9STRA|nr:NAD dependent epimerase dehydratase [Seminavis robusta]|eukprot:Sro1846_g301390.1 NAD dependent epimerase dehydratase (286) ;mRNA; f:17007-17864
MLAVANEPEPIRVAYAGFGKSGTRSLAQALTRLGYKTCHGTEMIAMKGYKGIMEAFADDRIDDALRLTEEEGCNATFEVHSWWWQEVRKKRPNAKFIVVIRDYDRWEPSMQHTLKVLQPMLRYPFRWVPVMDVGVRVMVKAAMHSMDVGPDYAMEYLTHPTDEKFIAKRKQMYDKFVVDGTKFAQKEPKRALLFHLKDGYAPLCQFLGVDNDKCPIDEPFPHINTRWELTITIAVFMIIEVSVFLAPVLVILVVARKLWLRRGTSDSAAVTDAAATAERRNKKHK